LLVGMQIEELPDARAGDFETVTGYCQGLGTIWRRALVAGLCRRCIHPWTTPVQRRLRFFFLVLCLGLALGTLATYLPLPARAIFDTFF